MKRVRFFFFVFLITTLVYWLTAARYGAGGRPFSIRNYLIIAFIIGASGLIHQKNQGDQDSASYRKSLIFGNSGQPGRVVYMDYLRVLAAVLVIAVHVMEPSYEKMELHDGTWLVMAVVTSIFCCCNLLFMMISGALLLNGREEPLFQFYKKRLLKVLIPCFAYYLFYCFYAYGSSALRPSNWYHLIQGFTANSTGLTPHFWLVYIILVFYLTAPLFSIMIKHMTESMMSSLVAVIFLLHVLYTYAPYFQLNFAAAPFLASWESIFLLGYYCTTDRAMKHYRLIMAGGAVSVLFIVYAVLSFDDFGALIYNNAPPMLLISCAVFLFFRKHGETIFAEIPSVLSALGKYSFSILLIHWFVLFEIVENKMGLNGLRFGIAGGTVLTIFLTLVISMGFSVLYDQTVVLCMDRAVRFLMDLPKKISAEKYNRLKRGR
ncbi:acyltransferase [Clostridium sp. AM58-1XD]|uniref:acyltransferase n=1 Tax=Clostridium sp. AM58-1XD TaxID=2292307 RepID=UPI001FA8269A|nr:acyltransferase [Clostridium sp. AM58-1XD]